MRKKWLYFFIVLVLIILVLYVWRYKQSQVFENKVPANATKVINVNLRQIENHVLFDFLANPITYLKPREKTDSIKKPRISLTKGISIPRNVLFYSNADNLKNNWFSSIVEVNDEAELTGYLLKENFVKSNRDDVAIYAKGDLILTIKSNQLIIAIANDISAVQSIVALFENKVFLAENSALLKPLVNSKNDISFSIGEDTLQANFKDGIFELQGTLSSDLFVANENETYDGNEVFSMSGKLNKDNAVFKHFLVDKKDKFDNFTHLSLDSIVTKWNGNFDLNITSIEQKTDTIVSYEFDDDFNKVETKTTQEKNIPMLSLLLGQEKASSLTNYFYSKNAIQIIEQDTVFITIPVFKFLATDRKDNLSLRVNKKDNQMSLPSENSKLNFYFNAEKYIGNPLDIPLNKDQKKFLKLVKTTNLEWTADNRFSLKISLKDDTRNFLGQLIKQ